MKKHVCIKCSKEIEENEAIVVEKELKNCYSKSSMRFNIMVSGDLQIYIGAKMLYEGLDPNIFGPPMDEL